MCCTVCLALTIEGKSHNRRASRSAARKYFVISRSPVRSRRVAPSICSEINQLLTICKLTLRLNCLELAHKRHTETLNAVQPAVRNCFEIGITSMSDNARVYPFPERSRLRVVGIGPPGEITSARSFF